MFRCVTFDASFEHLPLISRVYLLMHLDVGRVAIHLTYAICRLQVVNERRRADSFPLLCIPRFRCPCGRCLCQGRR